MTAIAVLILLVALAGSYAAWEALRPSGAWQEWHDEMEALERVVRR